MELRGVDVKKRIEEIDDQIREIEIEADNKVWKLKEERSELEKHNKHLYVAKLVTGNYDIWDDWFYLLGEVTESYAKQWVKDNALEDEDYRDPDEYFAVSKEEYAVLVKLQRVNEACKAIRFSGIPMGGEIENLLVASADELAKQSVLIRHPCFQHVVYPDKE